MRGSRDKGNLRPRPRRSDRWIIVAFDDDEIRYLFSKLPVLDRDSGYGANAVCATIREAVKLLARERHGSA